MVRWCRRLVLQKFSDRSFRLHSPHAPVECISNIQLPGISATDTGGAEVPVGAFAPAIRFGRDPRMKSPTYPHIFVPLPIFHQSTSTASQNEKPVGWAKAAEAPHPAHSARSAFATCADLDPVGKGGKRAVDRLKPWAAFAHPTQFVTQ